MKNAARYCCYALDIVGEAMRTTASSICAFCSRMKRGRIYACARREGWNVLAFGQHLDDLAESFLMSAFHNGLLRTMKANYIVKLVDCLLRSLVVKGLLDARRIVIATPSVAQLRFHSTFRIT